jgi:hypothetical protein
MTHEKKLTPSQRKLLDNSAAIWEEAATSKDAAFMARQLVQATLPHKNPGDISTWSRTNGNITLRISAGYKKDEKTGKDICIGYPYGIIPRVIMFYMTTEVVRTKSPRIVLGNSLASFMKQLGLDASRGGKRSDATRLKNQMERLFNSVISFEGEIHKDGKIGKARKNMTVASEVMLWWNPKEPDQDTFESWVELSKDFYEAITAAPVPVDMRALQALKQSPLALDLYSWLTYEAYRANKSGEIRFETWEQLHNHIGGDYAEVRNFRLKANQALQKIKVVYPNLRLGKRQGGIEVLPESLPALMPREVIDGTATPMPAPVSLPIHSPTTPLKPETVGKFRTKWGRLDPFACQNDFDFWLKGKLAPQNYDAAFLGFATKWVTGKA